MPDGNSPVKYPYPQYAQAGYSTPNVNDNAVGQSSNPTAFTKNAITKNGLKYVSGDRSTYNELYQHPNGDYYLYKQIDPTHPAYDKNAGMSYGLTNVGSKNPFTSPQPQPKPMPEVAENNVVTAVNPKAPKWVSLNNSGTNAQYHTFQTPQGENIYTLDAKGEQVIPNDKLADYVKGNWQYNSPTNTATTQAKESYTPTFKKGGPIPYKSSLAKKLSGYDDGGNIPNSDVQNIINNANGNGTYYNKFATSQNDINSAENKKQAQQNKNLNTASQIGGIANSFTGLIPQNNTDPSNPYFNQANGAASYYKDKQTQGQINQTADSVASNVPVYGQFYGVSRAAASGVQSALPKDQNGNVKGAGNEALNSLLTPDHERIINEFSSGKSSGIGMGIADLLTAGGASHITSLINAASGGKNKTLSDATNEGTGMNPVPKAQKTYNPQTGMWDTTGYNLQQAADGGIINGRGTPKSDSILAKIKSQSFVVPAENVPTAQILKSVILNKDPNEKANLNQKGGTKVKVSDTELLFTPQEKNKLIESGVNLKALAPNAKSGYESNLVKNLMGLEDGGVSPSKAKEILHDGTIRGHKITDKQRRFFGWEASKGYVDGGDINGIGNSKVPYEKSLALLKNKDDSARFKGGYEAGTTSKYIPGLGIYWNNQDRLNEPFDSGYYVGEKEKEEKYKKNVNLTNDEVLKIAKYGIDGRTFGNLSDLDKERILKATKYPQYADGTDVDGVDGETPLQKLIREQKEAAELSANQNYNKLLNQYTNQNIDYFSKGKSGAANYPMSSAANPSLGNLLMQGVVNPDTYIMPKYDSTSTKSSGTSASGNTNKISGNKYVSNLAQKLAFDPNSIAYNPKDENVVIPSKTTPLTRDEQIRADKADFDKANPNFYNGINTTTGNTHGFNPNTTTNTSNSNLATISSLLGAGQSLAGILGLATQGKRPKDTYDPIFESQLAKSIANSNYGYTPEQKAYLNNQLVEQRDNALANVYNASGGNGSVALNNARQVFNDAYNNRLKMNSDDEMLRLQKQGQANALSEAHQGMHRQLFEDNLNKFMQNQSAWGNLLNSGLSNVVDSQRFNNNWRQQAQTDALYGGQ